MHLSVPASTIQQATHQSGMHLQVCEDWFTRMRLLLLRTSAAANAPHLTLHHAYARLVDLKSQLRHLQAAAAAEAAQQFQEQLQAQRQQAQLEETQAAEQLAEAQASSQSPRPDLSLTDPETTRANSIPAVQQLQSSGDQQQHVASHSVQLPGPRPSYLVADTSVTGSPGKHPVQQPPAASPPAAAGPSKPGTAPVSLFTGKAQQPSKPATMGLLEIQAEQEAEAARGAEAARAIQPGRHGKGKQRTDGPQPSRTAVTSQPGQTRVLQVGLNLQAQPVLLDAQSLTAGSV